MTSTAQHTSSDFNSPDNVRKLNRNILIGAIIGLILGYILFSADSDSGWHQNIMYLITLGAALFVGMLKMLLIPLVFSAITVGVAQLQGSENMKRTWQSAIAYFALSSLLAIVVGLFAVNVFKPGAGLETKDLFEGATAFDAQQMQLGEFVHSLLVGFFTNPISAMANGNIVAVVVFAIFFGIALIKMGESSATLNKAMEEFFQLMMLLIYWVMLFVPIGISCLLAKLIATTSPELLINLGKLVLVVIGSTLFHALIVLPTLLWLATKRNPIEFLSKARLPLITAFSTSSSAATLPVTMSTLDNLGVKESIVKFIPPIGSQINMDGTALYEAIAALFVAQLMGIELTLAQQLIIVAISMLASVGAPAIPSAGMVTMMMVLQSVGLPVEAIGILLPIDRLLDTVRTAANVEGDMVGSLIVNQYSE